ncbi:MAG: monooxygenase [Betaproteobacteria bacterium]|nr:MAG: monooxygenase [Betaproteobacteria bacterium]
MQVAVVGGSLGGLTAGLLLRDMGISVDIYERSPVELAQRGAGIGFLPESQRYLVERAGVSLDKISIATSHIRYLNRNAQMVYDGLHQYRFSSWTTIYRELLACVEPAIYHLDHEMIDWIDDADCVNVRFANGTTRQADLLICADGVGSTARARLLPNVQPQYAGYVCWRGMVPEQAVDAKTRSVFDDAITYYVYANSHALVYPIPGPDGSVKKGERLFNLVWYRNYLEGSDLDDLMTDNTGQLREISLPPGSVSERHAAELRTVAAARLPEPMADLVSKLEQPFLQVIYDIDIPRMAFGRVCLVGDAAFVARPHAAAGTAKAAADGWALAQALSEEKDVVAALKQWEAGQLSLGRQLLERTRSIGRRSQVDCNWVAGDPELILGLHGPGV